MFYQQTIAKLKDIANDTQARHNQKVSELYILQEAFRNGVKITDELKDKAAGLEAENSRLETELAHALNDVEDLARKNRDLEYQNGLLVTVLQRLQIPVKLTARKK